MHVLSHIPPFPPLSILSSPSPVSPLLLSFLSSLSTLLPPSFPPLSIPQSYFFPSFSLPFLNQLPPPLSSLPSGEQHGQCGHPLILLWIRDGVEDDTRLVLLHQLKGKLQVCKGGHYTELFEVSDSNDMSIVKWSLHQQPLTLLKSGLGATCISSMSLSLLLPVLVYMYTSKSHSRIAPSFHCLEYGKAGEGLHGNFSHDVINN